MTRGGNVLVLRSIIVENGVCFKEKYGRTGGEDKEFFKQLIGHGYSFFWCHEANVYEVVYEGRWKLSHYLYRNLMNGGVTGESIGNHSTSYFIRSLVSLICYTALLGVSVFSGTHNMYRYVIRVGYDFGRVMGCLGIVFIKERLD